MTKKLPRVFAVIAFGLTVMGAWIGYAAVAIVVWAVFGMDVDGAFDFIVLAPIGAAVGFALGAVFGLKVCRCAVRRWLCRSWLILRSGTHK